MAPHAYYEFAHEAPIVRDHLQPPSTRLRIFISYSLIDLAINASAGAAAAAAGAHVNGAFDARALQVGALAGLLKSAWHSTTCLIGWHFVHRFYNLAMIAVTNDFVFAELLAVAVAAITLGEVPKSLCIAALAAAIPLHFELVHHVAYPVSNLLGRVWLFIPCLCTCIGKPPSWPFLLVPFDALGGVVFAAAAKSQGYTISPLQSAAAAGAVFGLITAIPSAVISRHMIQKLRDTRDGRGMDEIMMRQEVLKTGQISSSR